MSKVELIGDAEFDVFDFKDVSEADQAKARSRKFDENLEGLFGFLFWSVVVCVLIYVVVTP